MRTPAQGFLAFSAILAEELADLRSFLWHSVYRHHKIMRVMRGAEQIVTNLARRYLAVPADLPGPWAATAAALDAPARARLVTDFVAGMTDRYAIGEHRRLFDATPELR